MNLRPEDKIKKLSLQSKKELIRQIYSQDVYKYFEDLVFTLDEHHKGPGDPVKKIPSWPYIKKLVHHIHHNDWAYVWKSRQVMVTWTVLSYCLWVLLFHRGKKVAFQSKKGDDANELIKRVKIIYDKLPSWKPLAEFTYCSIKVPELLSEGYGIPQGEEQLRQYTYSVIFSDEFGFQEKLRETFGAAKPTVDGGGKFIAVTTPPRLKNFAYSCLTEPLFKVLKVHYSERPDRGPEWKIKAKEGMSQEDWDREYELIVVVTGTSRIFTPFNESIHVNSNLVYNHSVTLYRGWDFGFHRPFCGFAQIDLDDRFLILDCLLGKDILVDRFAERVVAFTNSNFPKAIIKDMCDHAGSQVSDKTDSTSIQILNKLGIYPSYRFNKDKEQPANLLRRKMEQSPGGKPGFQIRTTPNTRYLIDGLSSGLVYKKDGHTWCGDGDNEDRQEEHNYYVHGIDGILYIILNLYTVTGDTIGHQQKLSALKPKTGFEQYGRKSIQNRFEKLRF